MTYVRIHNVPEPLLTVIGDMTVSFAMLEFDLGAVSGALLQQPPAVARAITSEMTFRGVRALTASLFLEKFGEDDPRLKRLRDLLASAKNIEERRNQITHSVWGQQPGERDSQTHAVRLKMTAKERAGFRVATETVTVEDLTAFVKEIRQAAGALLELAEELGR